MDIAKTDEKKQLRKKLRKELSSFCASPLYEEHSKKAASNFLGSTLYANAPLILAFMSLKSEADTHPLIDKMLQDKKKVAIPKTDETTMTFRLLKSDVPLQEQLECGNYGIEEPRPELEETEPEKLPEGTVILVPGMAFSKGGSRLGKGKGYYDSYIARISTETKLVGYAFSFQIVPDVPCEAHDKKVGYLVTEEGITICGD